MAAHRRRTTRGVLLPDVMSEQAQSERSDDEPTEDVAAAPRPTSLVVWFVGALSALVVVYGIVGAATYFATQ